MNERTEELNAAITKAAGGSLPRRLDWRSPLADDGYAEYFDADFLERIDVELPERSLESFWPQRGPHWDALARSSNRDAVLVEAKSHIPEIFSTPTQAKGESLDRIQMSLTETAEAFGATTSCDWSATFYQYTNGLGHL